MYVVKHTVRGNMLDRHLYEMTAAEFRKAKATDTYDWETNSGDGFWHEHVTAQKAHWHVKRGMIHSTPLYIDNGRVRYARDGC